MATTKFKNKIFLLIFTTLFTVNFTYAQDHVKSKQNLAFNFGEVVTGLVESTKSVMSSVFESKTTDIEKEFNADLFELESEGGDVFLGSPTSATASDIASSSVSQARVPDLSICEIYDATFLNTLDLDILSAKARVGIDKIEDRIDEEMELRAEIFWKSKKLTELEKKEKVVFSDMRKEVLSARKFYNNIDGVVSDTSKLLESISCEDADKKSNTQIQAAYVKTDEFLVQEPVFRKSFTSSLKEKMSILQTGVKDVKEAGK